MTHTWDGDTGARPEIAAAAYVDPSAQLFGAVVLGEGASVWPNVVIRAEAHHVAVGRLTNLQDFVMIHVGWTLPTAIGEHCSITHHVTLHGCTIGDNCLIGINATVMDGAVIGDNSIVAGHAFVREGTVVPPNSVVMGMPAKVVGTRNSFVANRINARLYHRNALAYACGDHRAWTGPDYETFVRDETKRLDAEFAERFGSET